MSHTICILRKIDNNFIELHIFACDSKFDNYISYNELVFWLSCLLFLRKYINVMIIYIFVENHKAFHIIVTAENQSKLHDITTNVNPKIS